VSRALESFQATVGRTAAGCWFAPGRLNLIGEHTDYNEGLALPLALPQGAYVAAAVREDGAISVRSLQRPGDHAVFAPVDLRPEAITSWAAYPAGVLWALREAGHPVGGLDLVIDTDLPIGAGLSSSAAVSCAVALAASDLFDLDLPRSVLAALAQRAENEFVGVPVGVLDQTASLLCRPLHALLIDARDLTTRQVGLDLASAGAALLVIDTGAPRELRGGAYADRRRACEMAARQLGVPALRDIGIADLEPALAALADPLLRRRARHVITENARVLAVAEHLGEGRIEACGPLLSASHASLRDDFEVSSRELDLAVEAVLAAGALGARMTGAGFGGCALALTAAREATNAADAVEKAFADCGIARPRVFAAVPSGGARRIA
jgi:galactokinase